MPRRPTPPTGAPIWIDLMTSDADSSRKFYCELFGWTADEPDERHGGYFTFRKDGQLIAGCMQKQPGIEAPDGWSVYLETDNAARSVEQAAARGAQVIVQPMAVDDLGTMAVIVDPAGAATGLWQPGAHSGFGTAYEPDAPIWFELHTRGYDQALTFYRDVVGWQTQVMSDSEQLRYSTLGETEQPLLGVMDDSPYAPEGTPAHWIVYFGASEADVTVSRALELGATVKHAAEDTPYGRLASLTDPNGAAFNIMGPNAAMPFSTPAGEAAGVG